MPQPLPLVLSPSAQADLLTRCGIANPSVFKHHGTSPNFVDPYAGALALGLEPTVFRQTRQTPAPVEGHLRFEADELYAGVITFDHSLRLYSLFVEQSIHPVPQRSVSRGGQAPPPVLISPEVQRICSLPVLQVYRLVKEATFFDDVFRYAWKNSFRPVSIRPMHPDPIVGLLTEDGYMRLENNGVVGVITSEGSLPHYRFYA